MSAWRFPDFPAGVDMEHVCCYLCGADEYQRHEIVEEDMTGLPGRFQFVRCRRCRLVYQCPRVSITDIHNYYDDEYLAYRRRQNWGLFTPIVRYAMQAIDRKKMQIIQPHIQLTSESTVLDIGCAIGSFLDLVHQLFGSQVTGIDFKDLSQILANPIIDFRCGLAYEVELERNFYDLVTMWHFLEHDYDPLRSLRTAHEALKPDGVLVVEVPRLDSISRFLFGARWPGYQAPQHTLILDRNRLLQLVAKAGFHPIAHLSYGAFPAYYYMYMGLAFHLQKGNGLGSWNSAARYFLGSVALSPIMCLEKKLNLAMQTVVCKKR